MIETPYLLFLGDAPDQLSAKVGQGIRDWRPENAVGQFRLPGCGADLRLTDMTLEEARDAGAKTLVIGVANRGGTISETWKDVLREAMDLGFDLAAGLHSLLRDEPDLKQKAQETGRTLHEALSGRGHRLFGRQDVYGAGDGCRNARARHEVELPRHGPDRHSDHGRGRAARRRDRRFHGGFRRMAVARQ